MIKLFPDSRWVHMSVAVSSKLIDYFSSHGYCTHDPGVFSISEAELYRILGRNQEFIDDYNELDALFDNHEVHYLDICSACDNDPDFRGWEFV